MERTKPPSRRKSEAVFGYVTAPEKVRVEDAARAAGESISEYVRTAVLARMAGGSA